MVKDELPTKTATFTALNWAKQTTYLRLLQLECVLPTDQTFPITTATTSPNFPVRTIDRYALPRPVTNPVDATASKCIRAAIIDAGRPRGVLRDFGPSRTLSRPVHCNSKTTLDPLQFNYRKGTSPNLPRQAYSEAIKIICRSTVVIERDRRVTTLGMREKLMWSASSPRCDG